MYTEDMMGSPSNIDSPAEKEARPAKAKDKARNHYLPVYEKESASGLTFRAFRGH